jgi:AcrR family transcriptional regulator
VGEEDQTIMSKRAAILRSATRAFATKGFHETSATELARMTGSAEGTVFYHFHNKETLFLAVLENACHVVERDVSAYLDTLGATSGLDQLERTAEFFLQLASDKEELFLLLHRSDAYELARVNQDCRAQLEAVFECFVGLFERAVEASGSGPPMAPAAVRGLALVIYTMVDGLVRMRDCGVYDSSALFPDLMEACRTLVTCSGKRSDACPC